ncbi:MAG: S8 family serine peptidase [Verrucomicrobiota bacterium]
MRYLLEVSGKYPRVVLHQEFPDRAALEQGRSDRDEAYVANQVLVEAAPGENADSVLTSLEPYGAQAVEKLGQTPFYAVDLGEGSLATVPATVEALNGAAEPNHLLFHGEELGAPVLLPPQPGDPPGMAMDAVAMKWVPINPAPTSPELRPVLGNEARALADADGWVTLYDVDWNGPPHVVNQPTALGGPNAPSRVTFGTAFVRESVGNLNDRPLELTAQTSRQSLFNYGQIQFGVNAGAARYVTEFDISARPGTTDTILFFQDAPYAYPKSLQLSGRYRFTYVVTTGQITVEHNGVVIEQLTAYRPDDLNTIRFSATDDNLNGGIAIDNLKITAQFSADDPRPLLSITDFRIDFPVTPVGEYSSLPLRMENQGTATLEIRALINKDREIFTVTPPAPFVISPGESVELSVRFSPQEMAVVANTLSVYTDALANPIHTVELSGEGSAERSQFALSPGSLDLAVLAGSATTPPARIENTGGVNLQWFVKRLPQNPPSPLNADSLYQWGIDIAEDYGSDARRAWRVTEGSGEILVGVTDSGVQLAHPDLQNQLGLNTGEIPNNNNDDDNNGFTDDYYGWDFHNDDDNPDDDRGHGTHVAGIIAAERGNQIGVAGVAPGVKILPLKFLGSDGRGSSSDAIRAVDYARQRGAQLINASWGGSSYNSSLRATIAQFCAAPRYGFFVASAGNDGTDNDLSPHYPSDYDLDGIISVAAMTSSNVFRSTSNYGRVAVDLAAPGSGIYSTDLNSTYTRRSGTSMAAPHVTGALALLLSELPPSEHPLLKERIMNTVVLGSDYLGRLVTGGRLNIYGAILDPAESGLWALPASFYGEVPVGQSADLGLRLATANFPPGNYQTTLEFCRQSSDETVDTLDIELSVLADSPLNRWRMEQLGQDNVLAMEDQDAVWDLTANPDGDAYNNLTEYVLNLSPLETDGEQIDVRFDADGLPYFSLTTLTNPAGATVRFEWSDRLTLDSWTSDHLRVTPLSTDPVAGTTTWKITFDGIAIPSRAFFRMVVGP